MSIDRSTSRWIDDLDLDEDDTGRPRSGSGRRSGLLLIGAAVPWLIVIGLLVLPGPTGDAPPGDHQPLAELTHDVTPAQPTPNGTLHDDGRLTTAEGEDAGPVADTHHLDDDTPAITGHDALELSEVRGAWRVEPGPEEAAALAVVIARSWLTSLDPDLEIAGLAPPSGHRYAEHLVVEAVEQPSNDVAIVTILALVLEGEETLAAKVRRLAVPIIFDEGVPRPGGAPWPLPAPSLTPQPLTTLPIDDPDARDAAHEALVRAGYQDVEVVAITSSEAGPVVVDARATTPDGAALDGPVWLRRHLDGFVVAGTTLAGTTSTDVTDVPAAEDPEAGA